MRRRTFLRWTLGAILLLALVGLWAGRWSSRVRRRPAQRLRFLSPSEFAVLTAVAQAMLPGTGLHRTRTIERIDETLASLPPAETRELSTLLWMVEHLPPILDRKLGFFTALSDADRTAVLRGWADSAWGFRRTGFTALKYLVMLHYYGDRGSWQAIGWIPMSLPQWDE